MLPKVQHLGGQGARDRALAAKRLDVEPVDGGAQGGERALQAGKQIGDEALVHIELAVGKELDQDGAQQGVVGRGQIHHRDGAQS